MDWLKQMGAVFGPQQNNNNLPQINVQNPADEQIDPLTMPATQDDSGFVNGLNQLAGIIPQEVNTGVQMNPNPPMTPAPVMGPEMPPPEGSWEPAPQPVQTPAQPIPSQGDWMRDMGQSFNQDLENAAADYNKSSEDLMNFSLASNAAQIKSLEKVNKALDAGHSTSIKDYEDGLAKYENDRKTLKLDLDNLDKEISEMPEFKGDRMRHFKESPILSGIGMFLMAASGFYGVNPSFVTNTINGIIDKDLELQKAEYNSKTNKLEAKRDMLNRKMNNAENDFDFTNKKLIGRLTIAKQMVDEQMTRAKTQAEITNLGLASKQIENQLKAQKLQFLAQRNMSNTEFSKEQKADAMESQYLNAVSKQIDGQKVLSDNIDPFDLPKSQRDLYVGGVGIARDNKTASEVANVKSKVDDVKDNLAIIEEISNKALGGRVPLSTEDVDAMKRAKTAITFAYKEAKNLGASLTQNEEKFLGQLASIENVDVGSLLGIARTLAGPDAQIKNLRNDIDMTMANFAKPRILRPTEGFYNTFSTKDRNKALNSRVTERK